jgi:hypothetical protein
MFVTQELVRNNMDVNERKRPSNITLKHKSKQRNIASIAVLHFAVEVDMDVNEHERPSNITLKTQIKATRTSLILLLYILQTQ